MFQIYMKELIQRHYEATRKRGLIDSFTSLEDFREKLSEEIREFWEADIYDS